MRNNFKKKGFTLIESLIAGSITIAAILGAMNLYIDIKKDTEEKNISKDILSVLKAVDTRISIDGYSYALWTEKNASGHKDVYDFLQINFISKNNKQCGRANGWIPKEDLEKNRSFLDCNFWEKKLPFGSNIEIKTEKTNEGFLNVFEIYVDLPQATNKKEIEKRFKRMNSIYNYFQKNDFTNKNGINSFNFIDKTNGDNLSKLLCSVKGNDCILKASWNKQGFSQPLKINGDNEMILSNVSFIINKTEHTKINTCLKWEKDLSGSWSSSPVDCGIGLYANTTGATTPLSVHLNTDAVNIKNNLLLDKLCNVYSFDNNGLKVISETPCGVIKSTKSGGATEIIQYVEKTYAKEMTVAEDLSAQMIKNESLVDVAYSLYNNLTNSKITLNKLDVNDESIFKGSIDFLENLIVDSNSTDLNVNNITIEKLNTFEKLIIKESVVAEKDILVKNLGNEIVEVKGSNNDKISATKAKYFIPNLDVKVGEECIDKNALTISKENGTVLTCKNDWKNKSKLTWQSNYYGEIGVFKDKCPTNWEEIEDIHSRFMIGSGTYEELWSFPKTYKSGDKGGMAYVKLKEEELPSHSHNSPQIEPICQACHASIAPTKVKHGISVFSFEDHMKSRETGGDKAHNNLPNYYSVKYCVYAEGDKKSPGISEPAKPAEVWLPFPDLIHNWVDFGFFFDCKNERTMIYEDLRYTLSDCKLQQARLIEGREKSQQTGNIRLSGEKRTEYQTINVQQTWKEIPAYYDPDWYDYSSPYDCSEETSWYENGDYYLKKECKVNQKRLRQEREIELRFGTVRDHGSKIPEYQTVTKIFKRKVAAAGFDPDATGESLKIKEGDAGQKTIYRTKIKLKKPFAEDVTYRVNTQDITTTSLLASTENLIYDEFGNPFISVVDNPNGGRLIFDGGFPKYYNSYWNDDFDSFKDLPNQFKFMHNIIKWISSTHSNRGKVLLYGDAINGHSYSVDNLGGADFLKSIPGTIKIAGYDVDVKTAKDFGGNKESNKKIKMNLNYLNKYSSIIIMSSGGWESFTNNTANNFATYVNNGGGVYIITDHDYFQPTGNQILRKFGSEFYAVVDRTPSHEAYKLTTILNKLKGSEYGDGHQLWKGLDRNGSIHAGGSEGNVKLFTPIEDIEAYSKEITFKAGETEKEIEIVINGDNIAESNETFKIILSHPESGIVIGNSELIITIIDDDKAVKSLSETCPTGYYFEETCITQKLEHKKMKKTLIKENETEQLGKIFIKSNENNEKVLEIKIGGFKDRFVCDDFIENIINKNNKKELLNLKDKSKTLTINNINILNIEKWYNKEKDKNIENKCYDVPNNMDATIEIKATLKEETYHLDLKCENGIEKDGMCFSETISKPLLSCDKGYKRIDDICLKI